LPLVRAIISERDRLFQELKKIQGLSPIKSEANFMIAKAQFWAETRFSMS
jgi:histidinol-phosphate/aromatic aminotransferase/cobyric acid decarboxylase-like protein